MVRSVLTLRAKPGHGHAVEDFYREHQVLERARAFPGCLDAALFRPATGETAGHLVVADWSDPAAYARWVTDPWRTSVTADLLELLDTPHGQPLVGGLFEPVPPAPSNPTLPEELS